MIQTQSSEPGFKSSFLATVSWILFYKGVPDYVEIAGHIRTDSTVIAAWLNTFQRRQDGLQMNMSTRELSGKHFNQS